MYRSSILSLLRKPAKNMKQYFVYLCKCFLKIVIQSPYMMHDTCVEYVYELRTLSALTTVNSKTDNKYSYII